MSDSPLLVNKLEDLFIPEMTTLKGECEEICQRQADFYLPSDPQAQIPSRKLCLSLNPAQTHS